MPVNAPRIVQFPATRVNPGQVQNRKPQPAKRRWLRRVVLLCTVIYLLWAGAQLIKQEMRMQELKEIYGQMLQKQQQLQESNESMQKQIDKLMNDPAYLEQLAREMGLVKPNDTIYLPVNPNR